MEIDVIPASVDEKPVVANLLELYIHDLSEFIEIDLQPNGQFEYPWLADYWQDPDRIPFLVRVDGQLAGFVLVRRQQALTHPEQTWDIAEFFITRGFRRRGIGMAVAHDIWHRHPGSWEVRVRDSNFPARPFWATAVASFTRSAPTEQLIEQGEKRWHVFSFASLGLPGTPNAVRGPA